MYKAEVIEVDLGDPIEKILGEHVGQLSNKVKALVEEAIPKAQPESQKQAKQQAIDKKLQDLYTSLQCRPHTMDEILAITKPEIPSPVGVIMRLKTYIVNNGRKHALLKRRLNNKSVFELTAYNTH